MTSWGKNGRNSGSTYRSGYYSDNDRANYEKKTKGQWANSKNSDMPASEEILAARKFLSDTRPTVSVSDPYAPAPSTSTPTKY